VYKNLPFRYNKTEAGRQAERSFPLPQMKGGKNMEKKSLGAFIAQLRKEKNLTQKQLAELLNVSDKTISHWECDENSPDISLLPILAGTLGVSVDELLEGEKKIIQPTPGQHYATPKSEDFSEKAGTFTSRALNKIKSKMTGDIAERYRYFRMLSLVGTVIACVALLSITLTNLISGTVLEYFMADNMLFLPGIIVFIGSLWTLAISLGFTLGARFAFSKGMHPSPEASEEEKKYIFKANTVSFNNLFLVFCSLPMALTGIQDILDFAVILNVPIAIISLVVLWLVLTLILNKKGILRTDRKKHLAIKYLGIFGLSFILVAGSLWFITEEIWFPKAEYITFDSPEEFKTYMETPKKKPDSAYRIDGVSPTIAISNGIIIEEGDDYVRNERVYGDGPGGVVVDFAWHNKEVYNYFYNDKEKNFHVVTYEAKIKQKDTQILVDDGVPIAVVMFCIIDAVVCFCLYKKKIKELTEAY